MCLLWIAICFSKGAGFDVNDLKTEDCAHINDVTEGKPIYFVHSIEGIGGPLRTLASKLTVPAYCFQTTPSAPLETIERLAAYYIQIMKKKSPEGPYRLAGYFYGAEVAFEMAAQLQMAHPDDPNIVDPLILLDGSNTSISGGHRYNQSKIFKGSISLIRAQQSSAKGVDRDYGLKEVTRGNVNLLTVPGDSLVQGESSGITAEYIMNLLVGISAESNDARKDDESLLGDGRKFA